jgi:hypothetical protein
MKTNNLHDVVKELEILLVVTGKATAVEIQELDYDDYEESDGYTVISVWKKTEDGGYLTLDTAIDEEEFDAIMHKDCIVNDIVSRWERSNGRNVA